MKSAIIFGLVAASSVLAAPGTARRKANHERRLAAARKGNLFIPANVTEHSTEASNAVTYSTNWAGAVQVGTGYNAVYGTFTVPTVTKPSGGSSSTAYSASAWVGIDGYSCESAILQTGVDFSIQNGVVSYDAWYEWYPDYAYDFSGITFSAGDVVTVSVKATSKTGGVATIENVTKGKTVSHTFTGQSQGSLCETNAEWIVEDFEEGNSLVPLVNFGTVTFTNAYATTTSGTKVGVSGSTLIDMSTSGSSSGIEATASTSGSSEVIVKHS